MRPTSRPPAPWSRLVDEGEVLTCPGDGHLSCDDALPSYDAAATAAMTERILGFLDRVDATP